VIVVTSSAIVAGALTWPIHITRYDLARGRLKIL
jgi:hypothetical protein